MTVKFIGAFDMVESLPRTNTPEYAFVGRSNVGKSSLLNSLVGQKIARTSNTPGRTQMINLFDWGGTVLVDLPGYGYARASKADIVHWRARLEKYLTTRRQLERVFLLVDSRHGLKPSDLELMDFCDANAVGYQIVLTKTDKAGKMESEKHKSEIAITTAKRGACVSRVCATSAEKKIGIEELKNEIKKTK